jgi:hypothetical protein
MTLSGAVDRQGQKGAGHAVPTNMNQCCRTLKGWAVAIVSLSSTYFRGDTLILSIGGKQGVY